MQHISREFTVLDLRSSNSHLEYQRGRGLRFTFQFCKKLYNKGNFDFLIHLLLILATGPYPKGREGQTLGITSEKKRVANSNIDSKRYMK